MEVVIKNTQRRIKIHQRRLERFLKKAAAQLSPKSDNIQVTAEPGMPQKRSGSVTSLLRGLLPVAEISVLLVNDSRMRLLNRSYRNVDKTTDVLSFPLFVLPCEVGVSGEGEPVALGDIVVNLHQAERQSRARGVTLYREVEWLLLHGLLHLIGYDHEAGGRRERTMRALEQEILKVLCR